MSHSADEAQQVRQAQQAQQAHQYPRDGGFSLVEVIVSLGVLMVVVVALLPQLVVGIRATGTARLVTQAKGVAQGELERMRNLPYYISPDAGDYRDVLDFYYRNLSVPADTPACTTAAGQYVAPLPGWAGYVSQAGTQCAYEPATGAFYRTVREVPAGNGIGSFTLVVNTRFISGDTPPQPMTPPDGYDTQSSSRSQPPSR